MTVLVELRSNSAVNKQYTFNVIVEDPCPTTSFQTRVLSDVTINLDEAHAVAYNVGQFEDLASQTHGN